MLSVELFCKLGTGKWNDALCTNPGLNFYLEISPQSTANQDGAASALAANVGTKVRDFERVQDGKNAALGFVFGY